jgi:type I restriction enzyme M protein
VPKKKKDSMAIYPLFVQHIMHVLKDKGKAAIVLPTGFLTAQGGADKKIRKKLVESRMLAGVVSMPSNIFATTATNVSILFLDRANKDGSVLLMDASKLGQTIKESGRQKTVLSTVEEDRIINHFNEKLAFDEFSIGVSYEEIAKKNFSLSAGQYFEVKIEYSEITEEEFEEKVNTFTETLDSLSKTSDLLSKNIATNLKKAYFHGVD